MQPASRFDGTPPIHPGDEIPLRAQLVKRARTRLTGRAGWTFLRLYASPAKSDARPADIRLVPAR